MKQISVGLYISLLLSSLLFVSYSAANVLAAQPLAQVSVQDETQGKLIYTRESASGCDIMLWEMKSREYHQIISVPECPNNISVARHGQTVILLNASSLQVVELASDRAGDLIPAPQPKLPKGYGTRLSPTSPLQAFPSNAGYSSQGNLVVVMDVGGPASDDYYYVFVRIGSKWKQVERLYCGTYENPETCRIKYKFGDRVARNPWGDNPTQIWSDGIKVNPYFLKRVTLTPPSTGELAAMDGLKFGLVFDFGSSQSVLTYVSVPSPDVEGVIDTFDLELKLPNGKSVVLAPDQCSAAVMGHYLLYDDFSGSGLYLIDLADGKMILENIRHAGWIY